MILQQVEPIKEEIRDTIRYMKDFLSQKAHELKPLHERFPFLRAEIFPVTYSVTVSFKIKMRPFYKTKYF